MFNCIYADPAWSFQRRGRASGGRGADTKYKVMTLDDMKALPVKPLAAKHSVLLMWASWPYLEQALLLGRAWGFSYRTCAFTWVKTIRSYNGRFAVITDPTIWHIGTGYWTRANPEICLLFGRGNPQRINTSVRELLVGPVGQHSAKPHEAYERIEKLVSGPYLELFARNTRPGWTSLGDEIDGADLRDSLPALAQQISLTPIS